MFLMKRLLPKLRVSSEKLVGAQKKTDILYRYVASSTHIAPQEEPNPDVIAIKAKLEDAELQRIREAIEKRTQETLNIEPHPESPGAYFKKTLKKSEKARKKGLLYSS